MHQKCGTVAILGEPNVGKSTLVNLLVGQKITIVSKKAQTTRTRLLGICVHEDAQIILIDTPGIFNAKNSLEKIIVKEINCAKEESDVHLLMINANKVNFDFLKSIANKLKEDLIIAINKVDLIDKEKLLILAVKIKEIFPNLSQLFMISALKNDGVLKLKEYLANILPINNWMFEKDEVTNITQRFLATEITREQIFELLQKEIPFGIFVEHEKWEEFDNGSLSLSQAIVVSKDNYKGIVIGQQGIMLKTIGKKARIEMQKIFERNVHLKLFVKVEANWQEKSWAGQAIGVE